MKQNRSVLILVQTMTATKSNLCEGSRADWRDGLAQCLHQLTGLTVIVHNDDGTGGRAEILLVASGFATDFTRTAQVVQRCKRQQQRCSYGRETGRRSQVRARTAAR